TAEKLYTLDHGTRDILASLTTPVTIDFYYSKDFPELSTQLRNHAIRVEEILEEFSRLGAGKLRLERHNPTDDAAQQAARSCGLQPHIGSMGDLWFLGAIITPSSNSTQTPQVITDFPPEADDQLEYQLIRAIAATQRTDKRRIGLYSTLPVLEHANPQTKRLLPTWWSLQQLEHQFTIVPIEKLEQLPTDLDLLMLVHPKGLMEEQEMAISEYLEQGGALIALLDPLSRADVQLQGRFVPPQPSTLPKLLQDWGITFHHTKVVADRTLATPMTNTRRGMETLPTLLTLRTAQLSQESPITAHLQNLTMFCAGTFDFLPREDIKVTPLATTTTDARLLAIYEAQRNAGEILSDFQPDGQAHAVALLMEAPYAKALLIGDADFLHNSLCINQTEDTQGEERDNLVSDNATLLTNAAEYLCSDSRLLRVRSRGRKPRTFQRIEQLARQTEQRIQELDAETYRESEDIRQQLRQLAAQDNTDSSETQTKLNELEAEDARRQEQLRKRQRQELRTLRHNLDRIERKVTLLCVVFAPAMLAVFALVMAWKRRA
ncbi:MAG: Gldg family protein, partial [Victivallales bacterium]|nr:Gldg family protein [Victivallales bacterium]